MSRGWRAGVAGVVAAAALLAGPTSANAEHPTQTGDEESEADEYAADPAEACADVDKGDLEFVFESVEIFVSRENVSDEDIAEWLTYVENWSFDENPVELDFVDDEVRDLLKSRKIARTFISIRNNTECPVDLWPSMLRFDALTELGEPIDEARILPVVPKFDSFPLGDYLLGPTGITSFEVTVLGLEGGWAGLVTLESVTVGPGQDFAPQSMEFTTVNRTVGPWPAVATAAGALVFLLITAFRTWRLGPNRRTGRDPVQRWDAGWLNNNVLSVLGFTSAALSALLAASGQLDRLSSVDLGIFIGINILLAGFAGMATLIVQIGQVDVDGTATPKVRFFRLAMVSALISSLGVVSTIGLLVQSMTFDNDKTPVAVMILLVGAGLATIVYAQDVTVMQTRREPTRAIADQAGDAAASEPAEAQRP